MSLARPRVTPCSSAVSGLPPAPLRAGEEDLGCLEAGSVLESKHLGKKADLQRRNVIFLLGQRKVPGWALPALLSTQGPPGHRLLLVPERGRSLIRVYCKRA